MGYSKVIKVSDHEVRLIHQFNSDGSAYAEDIIVTTPAEVDASRLDWLARQDGKIGVASVSFTASEQSGEGVRFPD